MLTKPKVGENDVKNKGLLIKTKFHGSVICEGCKKPKAIYVNNALKCNKELASIQHIKDNGSFQSGKSLFPGKEL